MSNEELLEANGRLVLTNEELDTKLYTVFHDLRIPINNVRGVLSELEYQLKQPPRGIPRFNPGHDERVACPP